MSWKDNMKRPDSSESDHFDDESNFWNKREKKSELSQYIILAVLCLILAYALSKAVR